MVDESTETLAPTELSPTKFKSGPTDTCTVDAESETDTSDEVEANLMKPSEALEQAKDDAMVPTTEICAASPTNVKKGFALMRNVEAVEVMVSPTTAPTMEKVS